MKRAADAADDDMSPPWLIQNLVENRTIFCQNLSVWVCEFVCAGVCVCVRFVFTCRTRPWRRPRAELLTRQIMLIRQLPKGLAAWRGGGLEKREGVSVIDCCSAESQKPHEKRIENRI